MSYLWQEFNIKTFPAETLVFHNGVFMPELSTYESAFFDNNTITIQKTPKLPVHIIYVGEIAGNIDLNIIINAENTDVFMSFKTINKLPAFLNIFVKNTGKKSVFNGQIIMQNYNSLKISATGEHLAENTGIFIKNRVLAHKDTNTVLEGYAKIEKNIPNCDSDISFSVMADENAKITMKPTQFIKSIPNNASHSASIYKPNDNQINYLRMAGLSGAEVKEVLENAFLSEQ